MRVVAPLALALAGCNDCTLLGDALWEVALWNLPEDADAITVTTFDGFEERACTVVLEPLETRGDWGPGPDEPDIAAQDCPEAEWVYTYIGALHVRNPAPRRFAWGEVTFDYTRLGGGEGGFDTVGLHPDWMVDPQERQPWCYAGSLAITHLDAMDGSPFAAP